MVELAQCVYFIKTSNFGGERDAIFWITAQELLLSSSPNTVFGYWAKKRLCSFWPGGDWPCQIGCWPLCPLKQELRCKSYALTFSEDLGFNWIGGKSLHVMNFAEQQFLIAALAVGGV